MFWKEIMLLPSKISGTVAFFSGYDDLPVSPVKVPDNLPSRRNINMAGQGILYAVNGGCQGRFYLGTLKGKVCADHLAVDEPQVLAVAKGLCADNLAVDKSNILAVPGEVFAFYYAVLYSDVFPVPEGILGVKVAVFKEGVLNVLEGIFSLHLHVPEGKVA